MYVKWDPADGSAPTEFEFDPEDMMSRDAVLVEKEYGQPIEMWVNGLRAKEAKARRILLWWHMRQAHPQLPFKDVPDFRMRQMTVEMNVAELRELWKNIARSKMDEERRDQLQVAFETSIRDAMEREGIYEGEVTMDGPVNLPKPV